MPGKTVLAPCPRNTSTGHALIQISHLFGHSSEEGLKNTRVGTGKSMRPNGCKQGGSEPPLLAGGCC